MPGSRWRSRDFKLLVAGGVAVCVAVLVAPRCNAKSDARRRGEAGGAAHGDLDTLRNAIEISRKRHGEGSKPTVDALVEEKLFPGYARNFTLSITWTERGYRIRAVPDEQSCAIGVPVFAVDSADFP